MSRTVLVLGSLDGQFEFLRQLMIDLDCTWIQYADPDQWQLSLTHYELGGVVITNNVCDSTRERICSEIHGSNPQTRIVCLDGNEPTCWTGAHRKMSNSETAARDLAADKIRQLAASDTAATFAAFSWLRQNIAAAAPLLGDALNASPKPHVRSTLLQLMGETRDPQFTLAVAKELEADNGQVRFWAYIALQEIGTDESLGIARKVDPESLRRELPEINFSGE